MQHVVVIARAVDLFADEGLHAEFLTQLTGQRLSRRLSRFNFPAREFPEQGKFIVMPALADQQFGIPGE